MILVTKVDNYKEINKELLSLINKIPKTSLNEEEQNISNTDWTLPRDFKREYLDYFYKIIKPYMFKLADQLNSKNWKIYNGWFQQYNKLENHKWHVHGGANFTNVYFIELPSNDLGTEILNNEKINLEEGDLLTFPACYYHRSPINQTDKRKTIISFNSDFYDYKEKTNAR